MQPVEELDPALLPNLDEIITEDGKPVDNLFVEKLYHLLTEPLITNWRRPGGGPFMVMANVGWFYANKQPPLVPDVMLILDVTPAAPPREKAGRSFFQWLYDKTPDVVIEVVSDKRGDEEGYKMDQYARRRLQYYVIFDPDEILEHGVLRAFELVGKRYRPIDPGLLPDAGLGLVLWQGEFLGVEETWLRWCDDKGVLIPTSQEENERLRTRLRAAGLDPDA